MAKTKTDIAKRTRTKEAVQAVLDRNIHDVLRLLAPTIDDWQERQRADKHDPREIPPGAAIHSLLTECAVQDVEYLLVSIDAELTLTSHREIAEVFDVSTSTVKTSWAQHWLERANNGEYRVGAITSHLWGRPNYAQ